MKRFLIIFLSLVFFSFFHASPTYAQGTFTCSWTTSGTNIINNCEPGYTTDANLCPVGITNAEFTCVSGTTPIPYTPGPVDGPWYDQNPQQFENRVFGTAGAEVPDNEIFGERYTYAQINWIINSLVNMLTIHPESIEELIELLDPLINQGPNSDMRQFAKLGIPGFLVSTMAQAYSHPPASGVDNVQSTLANLHIIPSANAQGGYAYHAFEGIAPLWMAARDSTYFIMVFLLVASGFMIMFRVKVNPQTVVSLQLMIPKIIMTLILVTFSYAIAGLVIDLIYLVISLVVLALSATNILGIHLFTASPVDVITFFAGSNFSVIAALYLLPLLVILIGGLVAVSLGVYFISNPVFAVIGSLGTVGALMTLVVLVVVIWIMFKIWWMLLKTYVTLMLLVIIGPWQIMLGLLPGNGGFGSWLRNIIANASVFVVVPLMFIFSMIIWPISLWRLVPLISQDALDGLIGLTPSFFPLGQVNLGSTPLGNLPFVQGDGIFFQLMVGYAILALTPKVAEIIRDALKVPAFKYGNAIGQPLGIVKGPAQAGASAYSDYLYGIARRPGDPSNIMSGTIDALRYAGVLKGRPGM